jgi:cobalt/nickel transport system ATP-binding protein
MTGNGEIKLVEVTDLHFTYGDQTRALKGLNLTIPKGSKTVLLGPNGAGKSTLLLHLNAINLPQQGKVRVMGRETGPDTEDWVREKVGLVFQDPDDQVFSATVWDDVAFGPLNMGLDKHTVIHRVQDALSAVGMWDLREKPPHHLSFGQKKRVAIAGVMAMDPEVMILDEPTAYLDPQGQDLLFDILQEFHRQGKTLLVATHDMDLAAEWADHVIIVRDGRTMAEGGPELLIDASLMAAASLRLPVVARIFQRLAETAHGTATPAAAVPRTIDQAVAAIKELAVRR